MLFPAPRPPEPDEKGKGFFGVKLVDNAGVSITHVEAGSPADKAGIRVNDIIVSIDTQNVPTVHEAREMISRLRPGMTIAVEVRRNEKVQMLKLKVGARLESMP
jgi:S1-C subfamily serine protease